MNSILQSDVFFFITSVSVIFITVAILIALIYVIKILKDVSGFFKAIHSGTEALSEDLSLVRVKLHEKGIMSGLILSLLTTFVSFGQKMTERQAQKKSKKKKNKK